MELTFQAQMSVARRGTRTLRTPVSVGQTFHEMLILHCGGVVLDQFENIVGFGLASQMSQLNAIAICLSHASQMLRI